MLLNDIRTDEESKDDFTFLLWRLSSSSAQNSNWVGVGKDGVGKKGAVGCGKDSRGGKWFRCGTGKGKPRNTPQDLDGTQGPAEAGTRDV